MKKLILTASLFFACASMFAQTKVVDNQSVSFGLIGGEYNWEKAVGRLSTVNLYAGLSGGLGYSSSSINFGGDTHNDSEWYYAVCATAGAQYRYYYNLEKRAGKGKNTRLNTANFWAIGAQYISPAIISHNVSTGNAVCLTPSWGLRRVYSNNWYIEFNPGLSIGFDDNNNTFFGPSIRFSVGFVIK